MAFKNLLMDKVRRKVGDWLDPRTVMDTTAVLYADEYYIDAVDDGLNRFNADTGNVYTITTLPSKYEHMIVLLGTIEMCTVRAGESTDSSDTSGAPSGKLMRVQVPGMETWWHAPQDIGSAGWLKLCEQLEDRYQDWLEDEGFDTVDGDDLPTVYSYTVMREDLSNNRAWRRPEIDKGLTAPTDLAVAFAASGRIFTWTPLYHTQHQFYQLQHKLSTEEWEDVEIMATIYDNHIATYTDASTLDAETYTFRLAIYNRNNIATYTNEISVVVS